MIFSQAELEELASADAEIDSSFFLSLDDMKLSKELDRLAQWDRLDNKALHKAIRRRNYRKAKHEHILAYQKSYRKIKHEHISAYNKAYYRANRDMYKAYQKVYYKENKERCSARKKARQAANRSKLLEKQAVIRILRNQHGLTQRDLARLSGVSQSVVSEWENGRTPADWKKLELVFSEIAEIRF